MLDAFYTLDANFGVVDPSAAGKERSKEDPYDLGSPASDVYWILAGAHRQQVIDLGREMAEITIPSVMTHQNYRVGDDLPGTNQSVGAQCVNTLASKLMFMAFPPGQPMMRLLPVLSKLQKDINADPALYAQVELALSQVELEHRKKAATTPLATAWVGFMKLLLVGGNALWKHLTLQSPTYHPLTQYVCSRDMAGHPLLVIHEVKVRLTTLDEDVQEQILLEDQKLLKEEEWSREATIFSISRYRKGPTKDLNSGTWEYWEETEKGTLIEGSEVTTPYDSPVMWPAWCIPVYGQNYGRSYCEEYRGDLFIVESAWSSLNDGLAGMSLFLTFVKPGGRTSLRQVQQAKNLSMLSGSAEDLSVFRSEKGQDMQFGLEMVAKAEQRLAQAFLRSDSTTMRQAERVTAEEVERTGQDLDRAMGGIYTELAQGPQRIMVTRFVRLNEDSDDGIPPLPANLVNIGVITGVDAMGRSSELEGLNGLASDVNKAFPPNSETSSILDPNDFATRNASMRGIKPDGLVKTADQVAAQKQQAQQQAQSADIASKTAGPMAGPMAKALADRMPPGPPSLGGGASPSSPSSSPPPPQPPAAAQGNQ